ncbi:MAG TPA: hypothetical protein V6C64_13955 [Microcoleaceae cyanobacterium]|jgi:hypothetical protein
MKYLKFLFLPILFSFNFAYISLESQPHLIKVPALQSTTPRNSSEGAISTSTNGILNSLNTVKFLKERADKDQLVENREILENVLKEKNLPVKFVESCGKEFNLTYARVHAIYEVEQKTYVISFICTSYIRSASFRR